jgi:serine/threonine protein kinase
MDIWGVGCVFFEMLSLFPLFPGNNEKDQVHKIHNILGTPPRDVLERFQKYASHMDFNFPHVVGTGISQLVPHVSPECLELISKLLIYNPDERMTARQALNYPYFKELRSQETKVAQPNPHKDLGSASPTSGGDEHPVDGVEQPYHQPNKKPKAPEAPADPAAKKRVQQGSKKWPEHGPEAPTEYDDPASNVASSCPLLNSCRP